MSIGTLQWCPAVIADFGSLNIISALVVLHFLLLCYLCFFPCRIRTSYCELYPTGKLFTPLTPIYIYIYRRRRKNNFSIYIYVTTNFIYNYGGTRWVMVNLLRNGMLMVLKLLTKLAAFPFTLILLWKAKIHLVVWLVICWLFNAKSCLCVY